MSVDYIIVQAGGLGTRLKHLTKNKPKGLVSVNNLPIIFHLFRQFPQKKFVIIADYKKEVLDRYLEAFCDVNYITVDARGKKGTCAGIRDSLNIIPPGERFLLIWSDIVLDEGFKVIDDENNYVGISTSFPCRWSYLDNSFSETIRDNHGVAGLFIFNDKNLLSGVPEEGEFVRWLSTQGFDFKEIRLKNSKEYGLLESIKPLESGKCRPFNRLTIVDGKIIKEGIDENGRKLSIREKNWYRYVQDLNVPIPKIFSYDPLTLERIDGRNPFEYTSFTQQQKEIVLIKIMNGLKHLHKYGDQYPNKFSMKETYFDKTFNRLSKVRDLIPFANDEFIIVNNKKCRNVFFQRTRILEMISEIQCGKFTLIHGDCTFSNILLKDGCEPVFIDPRGYFGSNELIGDPNYDWSKLYYSLCGDYDQFNLGRFTLDIKESSVSLEIQTNGWRCVEDTFIKNLPTDINIRDIRLIHGLIWLSLTTYAWDDYDSICGSFYNGLYYLEDLL